MPSPLPGMDPYLEHPQSWPNFHHRLIAAIAIDLAPQLRPKYRVVVEEALYQTQGRESLLVGIPDVAVQKIARSGYVPSQPTVATVAPAQPLDIELPTPEVIRQGYLEIRDVATSEVVTVTAKTPYLPLTEKLGSGLIVGYANRVCGRYRLAI